MNYKSPYSLIEYFIINVIELTVVNLKSVKKQILLEFDMMENTSVNVNDQYFSKHDILSLFDEMKNTDIIMFHNQIRHDNILRNFLETGDIKISDVENIHLLDSKDKRNPLKLYISPYLVAPISKLLNHTFNQSNFLECLELLKLVNILSEIDQSNAYNKLSGSLNVIIGNLADIVNNEMKFDEKPYQYLINPSLIAFLNELPDEFNNFRERFAIQVNGLCVMIQNSKLEFTFQVYENLRSIKSSVYLKTLVQNNYKIVSENRMKTQNSESFSVVLLVFLLVGITLITVKLFSGNNKKSIREQDSFAEILKKSDLSLSVKNKRLSFDSLLLEFKGKGKHTLFFDSSARQKVLPKYQDISGFSSFNSRLFNDDYMMIENTSNQDVIIFTVSQSKIYAMRLSNGSKVKIGVLYGDYIKFIFGKEWQPLLIKNDENKVILETDFFKNITKEVNTQEGRYFKFEGYLNNHLKNNDLLIDDEIVKRTLKNSQGFQKNVIKRSEKIEMLPDSLFYANKAKGMAYISLLKRGEISGLNFNYSTHFSRQY